MSDVRTGYAYDGPPRAAVRDSDSPDARLDGDTLLLTVPGGGVWPVPLAEIDHLECRNRGSGLHLHLRAWPSPAGDHQLSVNLYVEGEQEWLDAFWARIGEINRAMRSRREPEPPEPTEPTEPPEPPEPPEPVVEPYQAAPIRRLDYVELDTDWLELRPLPDTLALAVGGLLQSDRAPDT